MMDVRPAKSSVFDLSFVSFSFTDNVFCAPEKTAASVFAAALKWGSAERVCARIGQLLRK